MSWREEYRRALTERDERERGGYERFTDEFIEAYTKLLDRTAVLEAQKEANTSTSDPSSKVAASPTALEGNPQLKSDLAEALRSNGHLASRLKSVETELLALRVKTRTDVNRLEEYTKERAVLIQKVKDRDDESKEKRKLLETTQDEMISLELQLSLSEQNIKKLKSENKELIDRWMASKGREADEMNKRLG